MTARRLGKPGPINKQQIVKIHVLASRMLLPDGMYRSILQERFGVQSCKALNCLQAEDLIAGLKHMGWEMGFWDKSADEEKYNELGERPGMATPSQLRMVESIFSQVTKPETDEERDRRLRGFLFKFFKVSHMKFLDAGTVGKPLSALRAMKERGEAKKAEDVTQCALQR